MTRNSLSSTTDAIVSNQSEVGNFSQLRFHARIALYASMSVVTIAATSASYANTIVYNPSLGTLPQAQGFTLQNDPPASPDPTVSAGILHQGPTALNGYQFWTNTSVPLDFAAGFTIEANLKVLSSNYYTNVFNEHRSGYYFLANDSLVRSFAIGIASTGITINTDAVNATNQGLTFTPFDTTDAYHTYRFVSQSGTGKLYIDNTLFGSVAMGSGGMLPAIYANRVAFGDASSVGSSQTQLKSFLYSDGVLAPSVPEPTTTTLLTLGVFALALVGLRRSKQ